MTNNVGSSRCYKGGAHLDPHTRPGRVGAGPKMGSLGHLLIFTSTTNKRKARPYQSSFPSDQINSRSRFDWIPPTAGTRVL